jgi:hypothetical protein
MPYEAPGARHSAVATKACAHGQIVVEDGIVGTAFKTEQIGRFVDPSAVTGGVLTARHIPVDESFEIQVGGIHEAPLAGALAGADVGDRVWIDPTDNSLEVASAAGRLPVGVISEVDATRTPDVARINSNAWSAFLVGA